MPFLSILNLHGNHLTCSIEVHNPSTPSRLEYLHLGYNHFEGKIIEPISKLINLKFPNILKKLEKLEFIALSINRIKGKIPEWL
ncbi:unnamed protein product, partial [Brassica oleracea]